MTRVLADGCWRDWRPSPRQRFRRAVTAVTRWLLRRQDGGAK